MLYHHCEPEIIFGKKHLKKISDKSGDNVLVITKNISQNISNSIIESSLLTWKDNLIVFDYKDKLLKKSEEHRKKLGKVINLQASEISFNPFNLIERYPIFGLEININFCTPILEAMYNATAKVFYIETLYKEYTLNLLKVAIFYLIYKEKEINMKNLSDFFFLEEETSTKNLNEYGEYEEESFYGRTILDNKLYKMSKEISNEDIKTKIWTFLDLYSYKIRDSILIAIHYILKVFNTENENLEIEKLFDYSNEYSLYISLTDKEDNISKGKLIFLIDQLLKNKDCFRINTLMVLPNFHIFEKLDELRNIIEYEKDKLNNLKLILVSDIHNLMKFENSLDYFLDNFNKVLFYKLDKKNEIIYSNNYKKVKIKDINLTKTKLSETNIFYIIKIIAVLILIFISATTFFNNKKESIKNNEELIEILNLEEK